MDNHIDLPRKLDYLIDASRRFGIHQSDAQVDAFLADATPAQMEELAGIAERLRCGGHLSELMSYLDQRPIDEYAESAQLYFLLGVLDTAGLKFEPPDWNSVESHVRSLQRFGSFRLASERMHAAQFLAEMGQAAAPAIPLLGAACSDEDERVQVWAHFPLARLVGDDESHSRAIRQILSKHGQVDEFGDLDEIGEEASEALEQLQGSVDGRSDDRGEQ
ncbi:hypothetical protein KOR34_34360 [Posidoniimonas corsicana]|uniref:HEAT repeat domain-containing protein n=1 Tax=Posidoniimonas corsicana TaxID=1938618 RepID=A0A5C5V4Z4_9BACT|nr:hypothetical protein [Posidoniimonas corsicana]TWT33604.1 hypothetical protein KOR34_34360 [Posidoniimonas corsicana]